MTMTMTMTMSMSMTITSLQEGAIVACLWRCENVPQAGTLIGSSSNNMTRQEHLLYLKSPCILPLSSIRFGVTIEVGPYNIRLPKWKSSMCLVRDNTVCDVSLSLIHCNLIPHLQNTSLPFLLYLNTLLSLSLSRHRSFCCLANQRAFQIPPFYFEE
jgi:hypothetical protein